MTWTGEKHSRGRSKYSGVTSTSEASSRSAEPAPLCVVDDGRIRSRCGHTAQTSSGTDTSHTNIQRIPNQELLRPLPLYIWPASGWSRDYPVDQSVTVPPA